MRKPSQLSKRATIKETVEARLQVFERALVNGQVLLHDEKHLFIAPLNNISAGGLFVDRLTTLPKGRMVRIVVRSPKFAHPVQAMGTVVRIEKDNRSGIAIEFTSITSSAREMIQNCVFECRMEGALKVA